MNFKMIFGAIFCLFSVFSSTGFAENQSSNDENLVSNFIMQNSIKKDDQRAVAEIIRHYYTYVTTLGDVKLTGELSPSHAVERFKAQNEEIKTAWLADVNNNNAGKYVLRDAGSDFSHQIGAKQITCSNEHKGAGNLTIIYKNNGDTTAISISAQQAGNNETRTSSMLANCFAKVRTAETGGVSTQEISSIVCQSLSDHTPVIGVATIKSGVHVDSLAGDQGDDNTFLNFVDATPEQSHATFSAGGFSFGIIKCEY